MGSDFNWGEFREMLKEHFKSRGFICYAWPTNINSNTFMLELGTGKKSYTKTNSSVWNYEVRLRFTGLKCRLYNLHANYGLLGTVVGHKFPDYYDFHDPDVFDHLERDLRLLGHWPRKVLNE